MEQYKGIAVVLLDARTAERLFSTRTVGELWHDGDGPSNRDLCVVIVTNAAQGLWEVVCPGLPFVSVRGYAVKDLLPRENGWNRLANQKGHSSTEADRLAENLRRLRTAVGNRKAPLVVYARNPNTLIPRELKDVMRPMLSERVRYFGLSSSKAEDTASTASAKKSTSAASTQRPSSAVSTKRPSPRAPAKTSASRSAFVRNRQMRWLRCNAVVLSLVGDLSMLFWIWISVAFRSDLPWHIGVSGVPQSLVDAWASWAQSVMTLVGPWMLLLMLWMPRRFTFHADDGNASSLVQGLLALAIGNAAYACTVLSPLVMSGTGQSWSVRWLSAALPPFLWAAVVFLLTWNKRKQEGEGERPPLWWKLTAWAYIPWYVMAGACCLSGIVPVAVGGSVAKLLSWDIPLPQQAYQGGFPAAWTAMLLSDQGMLGIGIIILVTIVAAAVGRRAELRPEDGLYWERWAAVAALAASLLIGMSGISLH